MATYKNGVKVPKKTKTQMQIETIMRANGWTRKEYQKNYDIFKNKLRGYENFKKAHGVDVTIQSPKKILYRQAVNMLKYGKDYSQTWQMKQIQAFSAVSISKGKRLAEDLGSRYSQNRAKTFSEISHKAFEKFIEKVAMAKEIDEKITDPVMKDKALADLAEHIHAKQTKGGAFTGGETYGSDSAGSDFDIDNWLYF